MLYHIEYFREQYVTWKAECQKMVPVIGTGKFITSPIITDDGHPIEDTKKSNMRDNGVVSTSSQDSEKKVIQWKRFLHQIGMYMLHKSSMYVLHRSFLFFPSASFELKTSPSITSALPLLFTACIS